ncbi:Ankyrin repeat and IBR domain-containing protein 1 [Liparis tanakae]|uniref:Ankyrin repeat and IBR domain-containing protein 1 n=1 Tax=Liparis tanakae TaxID=230148 RepID=A0A4Z2F140_9TELE|nr:Ankyrin repeat and IBR domain-containing protein 1 [Liparis tanakae]
MPAEQKHKSFQELDRFMHYFTRFKNHEHSCQVSPAHLCTGTHRRGLYRGGLLEQRLLTTATEKMEQLSRALRGRECRAASSSSGRRHAGVHQQHRAAAVVPRRRRANPFSLSFKPLTSNDGVSEEAGLRWRRLPSV